MKCTDSVKCAEPGCSEYAHYQYDTHKERREASLRRAKFPYRCTRHSGPEELLTPENLTRTVTLVSEEKPYGKFWNGSHGFEHGSGYKCFARDFPTGTKLTVTATIELPETPNPSRDLIL